MYLEQLRSALGHDVPILVKMAQTPLGPWQALWQGVRPGSGVQNGMMGRWGLAKNWAKANPGQGMALGLGAGLLLPRLMAMLQGLTNPGGY